MGVRQAVGDGEKTNSAGSPSLFRKWLDPPRSGQVPPKPTQSRSAQVWIWFQDLPRSTPDLSRL